MFVFESVCLCVWHCQLFTQLFVIKVLKNYHFGMDQHMCSCDASRRLKGIICIIAIIFIFIFIHDLLTSDSVFEVFCVHLSDWISAFSMIKQYYLHLQNKIYILYSNSFLFIKGTSNWPKVTVKQFIMLQTKYILSKKCCSYSSKNKKYYGLHKTIKPKYYGLHKTIKQHNHFQHLL